MLYDPIINLCTRISTVLMIVSIILLASLSFFIFEASRLHSLDTSSESLQLEQDLFHPAKSPSFDSYRNILANTRVFRPPLYVESIAAQKGEKKQLQLQGITGKAGRHAALIYDPENDSVALYSEGQYVRDLKVEKITTNSVILARGEDRLELKR
jgi:hypothetical protein